MTFAFNFGHRGFAVFVLFIKQIDELGKQWRFDDDNDVDEPEAKSDDATRCTVESSSGVESCTASERLQLADEDSLPVLTPSPAASANPPTPPSTTTATSGSGLESSPPPRSPTPVTAHSTTDDCLPPYSPPEIDSVIQQLMTSQRDDDVTQNAADSTPCNMCL